MKEEPKQETPEEARVNNLIKLFGKDFDLESSDTIKNCNVSFEEGAKWQKEQDKKLYSEQEVLRIITECKSYLSFGEEFDEIKWFEQFKK